MAEGGCSGEHFVEKYQADLIKRVSKIEPILDEFLHESIITQSSYDKIHSLPTSQKKMAALFSGPLLSSQGKAMFYKLLNKHEPHLINELRRTEQSTMASVKKELLETLDLSYLELEQYKRYLQRTRMDKGLRRFSRQRLETAGRVEIVEMLMETYDQQIVEETKEVLKKMNGSDLIERLRPNMDTGCDLPPIEADMASVKEALLETLKYLSYGEREQYKRHLQQTRMEKGLPRSSRLRLETADRVEIVETLMETLMETYGQQIAEETMEVLKKMKRTDLIERLSETSFRLTAKRLSKPIQREADMASMKEALLETLEDLSYGELEQYKRYLHTRMEKCPPRFSILRSETTDRVEMVDLLMETYDQQIVEETMEVLKKMKRTDLIERLSEKRLRLTVKRLSKRTIQREADMASVKEALLETLEDLSYGELEQYKWYLQHTRMDKGLPRSSRQRLETADRDEIVKMMMETYDQQTVEETKEVLKKMKTTDLVERLSETSFRLTGPAGSLDHEDCGSMMQVFRHWTKLNPEVNSKDADDAPIYSLQSEAGTFECSVSGLRWICKGKVSFKYQFCSFEEHMESIKSQQYMPAGPLMDITVIVGKLDEVYLPHWICIDDNPTILDKFAALHINDCGVVVEKVSEVTSSHVKLCEPVFSLRAVLMKVYFHLSVKINCNVLIYKTNTAFLTLHVYLIPRDPGLQQELDKRALSYGCKEIQKPNPEKSLKMKDCFILTTDLDGAEIGPETLMLRYESTHPNFFEVFIDDPDSNFKLKLTKENESQPVWTCTLRKNEYQSTVHVQGEHFVDEHRAELIDRVDNVASILDVLLNKKVISQGSYDEIRAIPNNRDKMRKLYSGPLNAAGCDGKEVFYKLLEENEYYLMENLKKKKKHTVMD